MRDGAAARPEKGNARDGRSTFALRLAAVSALVSTGVGIGVSMSCVTPRDKHDISSSSGSTKPDAGDAGFENKSDGAVFCGSEVHSVVAKPPLLYFVMDASGSMNEDAGGGKTRYEVLHGASVDLVKSLGSLIRVGAAVFPHNATEQDACAEGTEVLSPQYGSASVTNSFDHATDVTPNGGTPTSSILEKLAPKFANASTDPDGPEAILLVTDGGPNCDFDTSCDASECVTNIEGECPPEIGNCCSESEGGTPANCIDRSGVLQAIHDATLGGAKVYVIGIAVKQAYQDTLTQMALVGGAAQEGAPFYYPVDDINEIESTFKGIAQALISCEIKLTDPPKDKDLTNVYFDGAIVFQDPTDGWVWQGDDTIILNGAACAELKDGQVSAVQVLTGCPTETPL